MKPSFKKNFFYQESRHIYRAFFKYHHLPSYLYHRFIVKTRIWQAKIFSRTPQIDQSYSLHLLCGHVSVDALLWTLSSWIYHAKNMPLIYIHEDGSFTVEDQRKLAKLLSDVKIVERSWAKKQASDNWLKNYPFSRDFREADSRYIYAIKMVDPYFVSSAPYKIIIDTDILFFNYPEQIINFIKEKKSFALPGNSPMLPGPTYMDYAFHDGSGLSDKITWVNSGIVGYAQENFSLDTLEEFCQKNGVNNLSRVIEQAGLAYILGEYRELNKLDQEKYFIKGPVDPGETVLKHYTGPRREEYWFEGVKFLKPKILI